MSGLDSTENSDGLPVKTLGYSDAPESGKKRGRKAKSEADLGGILIKKPLKLSLDEEKLPEGLVNLLAIQKQYGVRYDLGDIILEALSKLSETDWAELSAEKIPENVIIMAALEDPEMRERLMSIINSTKLQN